MMEKAISWGSFLRILTWILGFSTETDVSHHELHELHWWNLLPWLLKPPNSLNFEHTARFWVRLLILSPEVEGALCAWSPSSVLFWVSMILKDKLTWKNMLRHPLYFNQLHFLMHFHNNTVVQRLWTLKIWLFAEGIPCKAAVILRSSVHLRLC